MSEEFTSRLDFINRKIDDISSVQVEMKKSMSNLLKSFILAGLGIVGGVVSFAIDYGGVKNQSYENKADIQYLQKAKQDKETIDDKFTIIIDKIKELQNEKDNK